MAKIACVHQAVGYSTDHQFTARAVNLGKNWVKKKCAINLTAHLEEYDERKKTVRGSDPY